MLEVVVGEEKVFHLGWLETGLDQGDRAAAEHQGLVADAQGVGAAQTGTQLVWECRLPGLIPRP